MEFNSGFKGLIYNGGGGGGVGGGYTVLKASFAQHPRLEKNQSQKL